MSYLSSFSILLSVRFCVLVQEFRFAQLSGINCFPTPFQVSIANILARSFSGVQDVQVLNLTLPEPQDSSSRLRPRFIPVVLPEDLARRINVLHGDPAVWWIGQFFKYLLRPQSWTSETFDAYADRVRFQKPIVG